MPCMRELRLMFPRVQGLLKYPWIFKLQERHAVLKAELAVYCILRAPQRWRTSNMRFSRQENSNCQSKL